jgi:superkiller protein 3
MSSRGSSFASIALLAGASFATVQARQEPAAAPEERAAAAIARGEALMQRGQADGAEAAFVEAVQLDPNCAVAWNRLGEARHAQKDWSLAADAFARVEALAPREPAAFANRGVCFFSMQELDRARAEFAAALAIDATHSRAHLYLGRIAVARGEDAVAEREFALAVASPAVDPLAPFYQGLHFFQLRRLDEAEAAFRRALELAPDLHSAHLNLALVLQRRGRTEEAARHLERFREITELEIGRDRLRQRVAHWLKAANKEIEDGNLDAALALCLQAADAAPDAPIAYLFLSRVYRLLGREEDSARAAQRHRELSQPEPVK